MKNRASLFSWRPCSLYFNLASQDIASSMGYDDRASVPVSFDEKKNVYRANQLLKVFNCSETIKEEMNERNREMEDGC